MGNSENLTLLKATDVARILNISRAMAYKLMQTRQIPTVHIGQSKRVQYQDLMNYIQSNKAAAA